MNKRTYRIGIEAVSTDAAAVIALMMPSRPEVDVKRRKHDTRKGIKLSNPVQLMEDSKDKWQQDRDNKGRWTHTKYRRMNQKKTRSGKLLPYKYGHNVDESCPRYVDQRNCLNEIV